MLVYLHIPFCHRVCPYCSFYKHTPGNIPMGAFVEAIATEARLRLDGVSPRTLYLGGGTPSMLSPTMLKRLFKELHRVIDFSALEEVTLEANPATFDAAKARLFRDLGVSRVSLGIQSFSENVLQTLGREHSPQQAVESVAILREAGIPQVNIDLMFSIPGQSDEVWEETLDQALLLRPDHLSAYNLTYEEDTTFFESLKRGEHHPDEDVDAHLFHRASAKITAAGYRHYETSNYALPGAESIHNQGYWSGSDYIGLGPSAVSTIGDSRLKNVADTGVYLLMVRSIGHAVHECEPLDPSARRIERIAMGLRTDTGIPIEWLDAPAREKLSWLVDEQLATVVKDHLVLIGRGRGLVDPIVAELL